MEEQMLSEALDCNGKDSGKEECWPVWVNVGGPIIISIAFILVLMIMLIVWPNKSPSSDEEDDGQVFVPPKWIPSDNTLQFGGSSNSASISNTRQLEENFV